MIQILSSRPRHAVSDPDVADVNQLEDVAVKQWMFAMQ